MGNVAQYGPDYGIAPAAGAGTPGTCAGLSSQARGDAYQIMKGFNSILAATRAAGVPRLLIVGGAGSLEVAPGKLVIDSGFPDEYRATAEGAKAALEALRAQQDQAWTMLSPAAEIFPGERTGKFRLGGDSLLSDAEGNSRISVQDYAVAMIDELEEPRHGNRRFTVAY